MKKDAAYRLSLYARSVDYRGRLRVGGEALLEISQIGKICHERCAIFYQAGDCVMPREGIFAVVLAGGPVKSGDSIAVVAEEER